MQQQIIIKHRHKTIISKQQNLYIINDMILGGYTGSGGGNGLSTPSQDASQLQHHSTVWCNFRGINPIRHPHTSIMHSQQPSHLGKPLALILMEDLHNLFDPDSLATLLLFLFIDSNEFNHSRLYTILRNISYHAPTREWIINALISIIRNADRPCCAAMTLERQNIQPKWLKLKVDAAFGFKSNTFILDGEENGGIGSIKINPQAAQQVVKNCLNLLFVLAKQFPRSFIPVFTEKKVGNTFCYVIQLKLLYNYLSFIIYLLLCCVLFYLIGKKSCF